MIPLRVAVDGFMSYRDEAELVFEGAPLWVLAGRNGSGKSAIFDAITYALYGTHRGGSQNAKALINHDAKSLSVEFDFAVGDETYRVKRTLGRKSTPTVQAFRLDGGEPVPVPETETKAGFDRWALATIGLDARTFTASVLLQQGKSEALLDADPKIRHEMLAQVIDLSAYERLYERAEERYKGSRAVADAAKAQLGGLAPVDEEEIGRALEAGAEAAREAELARSRVERLLAIKAEARRWAELEAERGRVEREIAEAEALVARAEAIERDAARGAELARALPALERAAEERDRHADMRAALETAGAEATRLAEAATAAAAARDTARAAAADLTRAREAARAAREAATVAAGDLAPHLSELKRLADLRLSLAEIDRSIAAYSESLDRELALARTEVDALADAKAAVPLLRIIAASREAARRATADEAASIAALESLEGELTAAAEAAERAADEVRGASRAADEATRRETEANTLVAETRRRAARFDEVDGGSVCSACGQPLTPEHLAAERERIERELRDRESAVHDASRAAGSASSRRDRLADASRAAEEKARRIAGERESARRSGEAARDAASREEVRSRDAIASLPESYAARAASEAYPSQDDVRAASAEAGRLDTRRRDLADLTRAADEREKVLARRAVTADDARALEAEYPPEREADIRAEASRVSDATKAADADLARFATPIAEAEARAAEAVRAADAAAAAHAKAASALESSRARADEIARALARAEADVPDAWRETAASLDAGALVALRAEAAGLANAGAERERLDEARREGRARERRLREAEAEAERVPEEARRPVEELDADERLAREAFAAADERRSAADAERRELEGRRERRGGLERQFLDASRDEHLYRELAKLLGRDRLQRHLLQQAESAVTMLANEVLDRLSGGNLWLELRREAEGEGKGTPKALDLVAYNGETGRDAIPVAFLSGSQRFRVAVSLALAIGRYAGQGGRRIESVIIDEGFGSLDREGRREMIDELHALKSTLDRIILVSHQEEFAGAFANKYVVDLVDGTSRARLATDE